MATSIPIPCASCAASCAATTEAHGFPLGDGDILRYLGPTGEILG